jgi:hypothetical protein
VKTYAEKLRDPRWKQRRQEIIDASRNHCENCDAEDTTFNVHHKIYIKGREPWDYDDEHLECLCRKCHKEKHNAVDYLVNLIKLNDSMAYAVAGFIHATAKDYNAETSYSEFKKHNLVCFEFIDGYLRGKIKIPSCQVYEAIATVEKT